MRVQARRWALALAAVLAMGGAGRAAGPLDAEVPQDAVFYLGWAGSDALEGAYGGSNLKGVVEASGARAFIKEQLPKLIEMAGKEDPGAPAVIAKLQTGLGVAWRHPTAFYFCPVTMTDPNKAPELRFGLLCEAGGDAKGLTDLLTEAVKGAGPAPDLPIAVGQDGTIVSLTFGKAQTAVERRKGGGLAAVPAYQKAMANCKVAKPALAGYGDLARGVSNAKDIIGKATHMTADDQAKVAVVIDGLGVEGLGQMATVSGFEGKEWSDQSFVGINGAPKGLVGLMGGAPLSDGVLSAVPKDAVFFATMKVDLREMFTDVRTVVGKVDAGALRELDGMLAQGNQMLGPGTNLETDLIGALGDESVIYQSPVAEVGGYATVLVQKVRDGERLAGLLSKIEAVAAQATQGQLKAEKMKSGAIEYSSLTMLQYSAAWTVRNGYLYVSSMEGLPGAVKQVENKLPTIAESELYKKAMAAMPAGVKPTALSYANPAKLYPPLRRTLLGLLPVARAAGVDLPADLLPDPDAIAAFMTPSVQVSWTDAAGVHSSGRSAFPGAAVMGGNPGGTMTVAVAAGGVAILLPALGRAREMAKRTADGSSLKGVMVGCMIYGAEHNDKMPDDLSALVASGMMSPKQLVSKRAGTEALVMTPELEKMAKEDTAKFAGVVAEHCDFVYLGKGMSTNTAAIVVIAYEKSGPWSQDGINLAFADGHVEFVRWAGMEEAFRATNEALRKRGVPVVDVAEMMRKSGAPAVPIRTVPGLP